MTSNLGDTFGDIWRYLVFISVKAVTVGVGDSSVSVTVGGNFGGGGSW